MKFSRRCGASAAVLLLQCIPLASSLGAVPTAATQSLLADKPGLMGMVTGERLTSLYGVVLADSNEPVYAGPADTDAFVAAFLAEWQDAFGVDGVEFMVPPRQITIRNGELKVYTYDQKHQGLVVQDSAVKIVVLLGSPDKIIYTSFHLVPVPTGGVAGSPQFELQDAIDEVQADPVYGSLGLTYDAEPRAERVIYEDANEVLHETWRFAGWNDGVDFLFFVRTGAPHDIVAVVDRIGSFGSIQGRVTGRVSPILRTGDPHDDFCRVCVGLATEGCGFPSAPNEGGVCASDADCCIDTNGDGQPDVCGTCQSTATADCRPSDQTSMCVGGDDHGKLCDPDKQCSPGFSQCTSYFGNVECVGGYHDGQDACTSIDDCWEPYGFCRDAGGGVYKCQGGPYDLATCDVNADCGTGVCTEIACPTEVSVPLPNIRVSVNTLPDAKWDYADAYGNYSIDGVAAGQNLTVSTDLDAQEELRHIEGEWIKTTSVRAPTLVEQSGVTTVDPVSTVDLDFDLGGHLCDPIWPDQNDAAQVNAYHAGTFTHNWLKALVPGFDAIDQQVEVIVGCGGGGYGEGLRRINLDHASRACSKHMPASSELITHEYGHFVAYRLDWLVSGSGGIIEGFCDTLAALVWDTPLLVMSSPPLWIPVLGEFYEANPLRNADWPDICLGSDIGDSVDSHDTTRAISGSFWDLRKRLLRCEKPDGMGGMTAGTTGATCDTSSGTGVCVLGADAGGPCSVDEDCDYCSPAAVCTEDATCTDDSEVERIFADFLFITEGHFDESVLIEVLIATEDDGPLDPDNLTTTQQKIIDVFVGDDDPNTGIDEHGWSRLEQILCSFVAPENDVLDVDWVGPDSQGLEPVAGSDYTVDYLFHPDNNGRSICIGGTNEGFSCNSDVDCPNSGNCIASNCVPHITLVTTEAGDPVVGVDRWLIGRTICDDATCLNPTPADIGNISVATAWSSGQRDVVEVRIGGEFTSGVRDVGHVNIPAQNDLNFTSIKLRAGGRCEDGPSQGDECDSANPCEGSGICNTGDVAEVSCEAIKALGSPDLGDGGRIAGYVFGTLSNVAAEAIGEGAEAGGSLVVTGDVSESVFEKFPSGTTLTAASVDILTVRADFGGQMTLQDTLGPEAVITIDGNLNTSGKIDVLGSGTSAGAIAVDGDIAGDITVLSAGLTGGIKADGNGSGELTSTGSISIGDLTGPIDILGTGTSSGTIAIGGDIDNDITIAGDFSGVISASEAGDLSAIITISGKLDIGDPLNPKGHIFIDGDIALGASITIPNTGAVSSGKIFVGGTLAGEIDIKGTFSGEICIGGPITGDELNPSLTVSTDATNAVDICASNFTDKAAPPLGISITGTNYTVCRTCWPPTLDTGAEAGVVKNRFISFEPGPLKALQAFRVVFELLPPPYDLWNNNELWVGPTSQVSESGSNVLPTEPFPNFTAATLQCAPFYDDWSSEGVVQVFHEGIVPSGTYRLQSILQGRVETSESDYSIPLPASTALWGDTVEACASLPPCGPPNGAPVEIVDVLAVLGRFSSVQTSILKARADLEPACLDLTVNVTDVLSSIAGFVGLSYAFTPTAADPCDSTCPPVLP